VISLLEDAVDAAGGEQRYRKASGISAHIRSGGLLMRLKGRAASFRDYGVSVSTKEQRTVINPYPGPGTIGVFDRGTARIERQDGTVIAERTGARNVFFGFAGLRRTLRWDELDALYFAGYALWNYLNVPFLFERPGFEFTEGEPVAFAGESHRRLDVTFPDDVHTHCRRQTFLFDSRNLLARHDYHPDVVSSRANAAHICEAHRESGGLVFPTRRRVVPKGIRGRPLRAPTIVSLDLDSIEVR
jgi:hypothetical protein